MPPYRYRDFIDHRGYPFRNELSELGFSDRLIIKSVSNATGGVDDYALAPAVHAVLDGRFQVSALGPDAGNQEGHFGAQLAHLL